MVLDDKIKAELKKEFESLKNDVNLILFTQKMECQYCEDTRKLVADVVALSPQLSMEVLDFEQDKSRADELGIDKIPALAVSTSRDFGIRFYGIPAGYEFTSLLAAIKMVSRVEADLSDKTMQFLDALEDKVDLQVFVTPTCPYCPRAVILAHQLALYSPRVTASMIEATEFPHLAMKYQVQGVPKTVINGTVSQAGAAPEDMLIEKIREAIKS